MTELEACLPAELRGPTTTITRIAAGLSGAGVYRVAVGDRAFVLKISAETDAGWHRKLHAQQLAAGAGLTPPVVHVDETRRAIVSAFVVDRSFPAWFMDPRTRDAAIAQLGQTLRRVHALPVPADAVASDPLAFLAATWSGLTGFAVPAFVTDAIERVRAEPPPARDRALVMSHNDVNPSNLVFDGERIILLDWDMAAPNEPLYDLATISLFLRMDEATSRSLVAAHDGEPVAALPARFAYCRRLVGALCGTLFLDLARRGGHAGATGTETLASTPPLAEIYQRMRAGTLSPASPDGQWAFGLALVHETVR